MKEKKEQTEHELFGLVRSSLIEKYGEKIDAVDINIVNDFGQNLLHMAATYDSFRNQLIGLDLIKRGINVNQKSKFGTPLHAAIYHGHEKLIAAMLEKNADPNIKDHYGNTALSVAVAEAGENFEIIKLLMKYGADPQIKNDKNISSFDRAIRIGREELIKILTGF